MDISEIAKKVDALEAELAAKSSRIADLEARVSLLEAENTRLRKAMRKGDANTGKNVPTFGRLEEGFRGNKQHGVNDVIEVSDSDSEEEGVAAGVNKGEGADEGIPGVPTPMKCAVRVVTFSDDEDDNKEVGGGGGDDHGSARYDANVGLDDDHVPMTSHGKKRAAAMVISDSEDDNGGVTSSRKRALRGMSDSDSEDDGQGVRAVSQEHASPVVKTRMESKEDHGELCEMEGCSTLAPRRSARLVKSQPKSTRPVRRALELVEPKDHEESEDSSDEDDSMDEFIDDADCSENSSNSAEESSPELEESDNEENYEKIMDRIRGKKNAKNKDWEIEAEMLSAFDEHPELTLKAVCALYRQQTEEEQAEKATIVHNKRGFSQIDARRYT
jgi:hypothetical protein